MARFTMVLIRNAEFSKKSVIRVDLITLLVNMERAVSSTLGSGVELWPKLISSKYVMALFTTRL